MTSFLTSYLTSREKKLTRTPFFLLSLFMISRQFANVFSGIIFSGIEAIIDFDQIGREKIDIAIGICAAVLRHAAKEQAHTNSDSCGDQGLPPIRDTDRMPSADLFKWFTDGPNHFTGLTRLGQRDVRTISRGGQSQTDHHPIQADLFQYAEFL